MLAIVLASGGLPRPAAAGLVELADLRAFIHVDGSLEMELDVTAASFFSTVR